MTTSTVVYLSEYDIKRLLQAAFGVDTYYIKTCTDYDGYTGKTQVSFQLEVTDKELQKIEYFEETKKLS